MPRFSFTYWNVGNMSGLQSLASAAFLSALVFVAWLYPCELGAQTFELSAPEKRTIVVEQVAEIEMRRYLPPVVLDLIGSSEEVSYGTPEHALISVVSAIFAQDYDWFLSTLDQRSRDLLARRNQRMNREPQYYRDEWREAVRGKTPVMFLRVDSGSYVFLTFKLLKQDDLADFIGSEPQSEVPSLGNTYSFYRDPDGGRWVSTILSAADPLMIHWADRFEKRSYRRTVHRSTTEW